MRAGRLDRFVTIQRKTVTYLDTGEPINTWSALVADRPASVSPIRGDERFGGEQYAAMEQTEFRVRWSSAIASLTPLDRVIYPSSDAAESPEITRSIYDIMAVHEIGRHEGLQIMTARQADVT